MCNLDLSSLVSFIYLFISCLVDAQITQQLQFGSCILTLLCSCHFCSQHVCIPQHGSSRVFFINHYLTVKINIC